MIIPAIDYINGKIVRLYQGNYNKILYYKNEILYQINKYINSGFSYIHLVDLDGCRNIKKRQMNILKNLSIFPKVNFQVGGGIRTAKDIEYLLTLNVSKVVLGTSAILKKEDFKKWLHIYGSEKIVLALDIRINSNKKKKIAISGWKNTTDFYLEQVISDFLPYGLKHVLCTDIARDGTFLGPNLELYSELKNIFPSILFQASGGIRSLKDVKDLKKIGIKNIIVGRALLEERFNLSEAIKC